jgi:phosphoenolpyruvate carboxylase
MSTLKYYAKTNIGSRPSKRSKSEHLDFADLRAIPLWVLESVKAKCSFFGVGTALKYFEETNQWDKVQDLYDDSLFFKTLLENSMMSLANHFSSNGLHEKDPQFEHFGKLFMMNF